MAKPKGQRAVIYARVSSKEQEQEGFSIPAQLRLLQEYADANKLGVCEQFVEAETAKRSGRRAFSRMLRFVKENGIENILAEKTDRLYRNFADYVKVDELGVNIHLVKEGEILGPGSKSHEKLVHGLKVLLAKNYIDNLSEEIRKGMGEKARSGYYPTHAPLGYLNVPGPTGKKILVPDPDRAQLVKSIFEAFALGTHSVDTVTKLAREIGLTSKKNHRLNRTAIHKILKHPVYTGRYHWGGELFLGKHEPLVELETFALVQSILEGRNTRLGFGTVPIAYRGLIRCAKCGSSMVGEIKKGRYVYYHCVGRRNGCDLPYVREECLTEQFAAFLDRIRIPEDLLQKLKVAMLEMATLEESEANRVITDLEIQASKLRDKLARLYEDKLSGEVGLDTYRHLKERYEGELSQVDQRRRSLSVTESQWRIDAERVFELCVSASHRFKLGDPDSRREILQLVLSNCNYDGHSLSIEPSDSFKSVVQANIEAVEKGEEIAERENWWRIGDSNP